MDRHTFIPYCSLALVMALLGGTIVASAQQALRHPGRVVEMGTNRPLSVGVKAWPQSTQTGTDGDCPRFGQSALDSTVSNEADGRFQLRVDRNKTTYTTTYCAAGYYPRADRDIPNRDDGSPVVPDPVGVYSRTTDPVLYARLVRIKTIGLMNDLAYLRSLNPEEFNTVLRNLALDVRTSSPSRAELLLSLGTFVQNWGLEVKK
jgi:hypothetical protein